jgi:(S)-2-hydroxy-acid oxidase
LFGSSITQLPLILKGILTADDATIAADLGVAGILVSNHGARQVDCTPASVSTHGAEIIVPIFEN